jgi:hypothetical protein
MLKERGILTRLEFMYHAYMPDITTAPLHSFSCSAAVEAGWLAGFRLVLPRVGVVIRA